MSDHDDHDGPPERRAHGPWITERPPRTYTICYTQITPESAECADFSDRGFGDPDTLGSTSLLHIDANFPHRSPEWRAQYDAARKEATEAIEPDEHDIKDAADDLECDEDDPRVESYAAVREVVKLITRHYGAREPSSSDYTPDVWYSTGHHVTDYTTGTETELTIHLDGWTDDEQRAIYAAVTGRK